MWADVLLYKPMIEPVDNGHLEAVCRSGVQWPLVWRTMSDTLLWNPTDLCSICTLLSDLTFSAPFDLLVSAIQANWNIWDFSCLDYQQLLWLWPRSQNFKSMNHLWILISGRAAARADVSKATSVMLQLGKERKLSVLPTLQTRVLQIPSVFRTFPSLPDQITP